MGSFAQRLRDAMQSAGLKAVDLHERTGISKASISEYLSGNYEPKQKNVYRLAEALHVAPSYLMGLSEREPPASAPAPPAPQKSDGLPVIPIDDRTFRVPVVGRVAAGQPIIADKEIIGYESIDDKYAHDGYTYFGLRIEGKSMEPTIMDGDIVIVRRQDYIESGQIGIILIDGECATAKEVKESPEGITLIGHNAAVYTPHFYSAREIQDLPVQVIGRVVQLVRRF